MLHASDYIAIAAILVTVGLAILAAIHQFGRRVSKLEATLNNGLCHKVDHMESLLTEIRQHFMWDGNDRRRPDE